MTWPQASQDPFSTFALDLACWAAQRIATTPVENVRTKANPADLVTDTDMTIEAEVRRRLAAEFPEHGMLGEEYGSAGPAGAEYTWYCDPVDGTTNYANGIGWCSFSLCCFDSAGPLVAVVADPFRRELAYARRDHGAHLLGLSDSFQPTGAARVLVARPCTDLAGTVFTTEWLAYVPWDGMIQTMAALSAANCTVRIMGSSALSLLQVGAGRAAACIIGRYSRIDDSASVLIGTEAGAVACGIDGRRTPTPQGGILLAAPGVVDQSLAVWRRGSAA